MPTLVWRLCFFHSSSSRFLLVPSKPIRIFFSFFSSPAKTLNSNSPFFNYLTNSFKLTETEALSISNRFSGSWVTSPEKPQSVHSLLREYGFSETQIRSTVLSLPKILFIDVKKNMKPKLEFFKQLGLADSDLESYLRELVSRVLNMGFSVDSRMFVHALYTVSCMSSQTFRNKLDLFGSFGFSEQECVEMFRRTPSLFRASEEKLKFGIDFFMNTVQYEKCILVRRPGCLISSMENRVIPGFNVLQVIKLKKLLNKDPSFYSVLYMTEEEFLDKFISKFKDDAEELLFAYKGHLLDSSTEES